MTARTDSRSGSMVVRVIGGLAIVFVLALAAWWVTKQVYQLKLPAGIPGKALEYPLWAALLGLLGNGILKGLKLHEWARPGMRMELFLKTGLVLMGASINLSLLVTAAGGAILQGLIIMSSVFFFCWWLSGKFGLDDKLRAVMSTAVSICGVSAAIATGGAIRARPIVPIMVSSLVVIFVAVEMVILPFLAKFYLWGEPLVAGAWMGLAVKSDGGAIASGAITDALIRAQALDMEGINYAEGWITMTATTVKMFIDIFIGVWAFLLAYIWCAKIDVRPGQKVDAAEIWHRFPKFVIGYVLTFIIMVVICWPSAKAMGPAEKELAELKATITSVQKKMSATTDIAAKTALQADLDAAQAQEKSVNNSIKEPKKLLGFAQSASAQGDIFRGIFFLLCFFTIGLVSNFKKLMEEGIGKLAAVYCVCLFGFIIWVGLFISWLFFHGVKPPIIS